ncbi:MAG: prohibitin family protein [Dehalococcoidia bacterium]|nr:prohibitin family protein [Dehalococcoidia bacterium]
MIWVVSVLVAMVVSGGVFLAGRTARAAAAPGSIERFRGSLVMGAGIALFVLWAGLHTALASIKPVEAGHVGVVYQFGEIVGQKGEGLQFIAPWQDLRTESIQVQRHRFDNVTAFSAETQDVFVVATVNYSVSAGAVQDLYRRVGPSWFDRLIEPRVFNFFKEEVVKYSTVDVGPNREAIRSAVRERLRTELAPFSIDINDLLIDNIEFNADFKTAIEQKQIATQDALREQERVLQRQFEAQQLVETAKGEGESIRVRAEGQAAANRLLAESLTPAVIQFEALQRLGDNIQIALIPAGQGIILDPTTLLGGSLNPGATPQLP